MELERLGKYELIERLGQGGMGEVWKARDMQLRRFVAIKFLHANLQSDPDFVTHFMREAQFVASLHHPNIVQIHDFQLTDERGSGTAAYMVMDYVEGGTLADYIRGTSRKGRFPGATDIVYLFSFVSLALDYAHQKGMVHRDIKPANILLDKRAATGRPLGEPILTDFGIAKLQGGSSSTVTHTGIGTPLYISPEQAQGHVADERSDLYSLGIILYEMMTGITPFRGENPLAIMMQHVHEVPNPPGLINPHVSPELSEVILHSIAKDPDKRFDTGSAMTAALAQALNVAAPSSLSKAGLRNEQTEFNPLQPARPAPGIAAYPPILTASPTVFTPSATSSMQAQLNAPAPLSSAMGNQLLQSPPISPEPLPQAKTKRPRRVVYFALIACVALLVIGLGVFAVPRLFSQQNATTSQNNSASAVGHITFVAGPNAARNTYDQLQISLQHIPAPPGGKSYYGWLENNGSNDSQQIPHWPLQVTNGSIQGTYQSNGQGTDLLSNNTLFLITEEDAGTAPGVPSFTPNRHLYYANITHSTSVSPTYGVKPCPSSGTTCN